MTNRTPTPNRNSLLFVFLIIVLLACQVPALPAPAAATIPPATQTSLPTPTASSTATAAESPTPTPTPTPAPLARRVLILSIDGLRPDLIFLAPMTNLQALMQSGAYSLTAHTVYPSVTLISHSSMLGGMCPSKHGVYWNDYIPENGIAQGVDLFDLAHTAGLQTVMHVGKEKLQQVTDASSLDIFTYVNDRDLVVAKRLIEDFPENFGVLFVHFPLVDGMGHTYGWLSPQQVNVAYRADEALGLILAALDERGLRGETLIIVSADHGGHDTIHGSNLLEDMTIPWIASGTGIQPKQLTTQVHTLDTATTAAFALGLDIPTEWDGVPVYEAFGLPVEKQSEGCK